MTKNSGSEFVYSDFDPKSGTVLTQKFYHASILPREEDSLQKYTIDRDGYVEIGDTIWAKDPDGDIVKDGKPNPSHPLISNPDRAVCLDALGAKALQRPFGTVSKSDEAAKLAL